MLATPSLPVPGSTGSPVPSALALTFPGAVCHARQLRPVIREFLQQYPLADDVTALVWELAANACLHSASGLPGGSFTLTVKDFPAGYVYAAVEDAGSAWDGDLDASACRPHGLFVLRELATDCGTAGGPCGRTVWFTIARPGAPAWSWMAPVPLAGRSAA